MTGIVAIVAMLLAACGESGSDGESSGDPATFFDGETVELIVPFSAGGGTDGFGRIIAEYLQKHFEGATVQVVNIEGGGDFRVGTADFAQRDPDGLTLLVGASSVHAGYMFGPDSVNYDLNTMHPLAGSSEGVVAYARPETGFTGPEDLLDPEVPLYLGGREPRGGDLYRASAFNLLGMDVNNLFGFEGRPALQVAYEQGELNLAAESTGPYLERVVPLVEAGEAIPLFTLGQIDGEGVVRDPAFPDMPHVGEVYEMLHGADPSELGAEWDAYKMQIAAGVTLAVSVWTHGDAPSDAIAALEWGMQQVAADPEYQAQAEESLGGYELLLGDQLTSAIREHIGQPDPEALEWLRQHVRERYDIELS